MVLGVLVSRAKENHMDKRRSIQWQQGLHKDLIRLSWIFASIISRSI